LERAVAAGGRLDAAAKGLAAIGIQRGVSRERVHQVEQLPARKLRDPGRRHLLTESR
jgi:DNA-directed RNA polymerase sigma subunit (sigma70/sigma32)